MLDNQYTLKKYNDDSYRLTLLKFSVKNPGFEGKIEKSELKDNKKESFTKLDNNISRARSKIWEYAESNKFDYFITLTLDKKKYDRYNLDKYIKDLSQYIRNNRRLHKTDIQYLFIPETHKDGAWHIHGLINGVNPKDLRAFTKDDFLPYKVRKLINQGRDILNWIPYAERFGYVTVERIHNRKAVAKYITKYINKDLGSSVIDLCKHSYFVSRKLNQAETIKKGTFPTSLRKSLQFEFENDYVALLNMNHEQYLKFISLL